LRLRTDAYDQRQQRVSYAETSAALTTRKQQPETSWRHEVSSVPTQQALRQLDQAFRDFFAGRARYPAFHTKRGKQSAEYTTSAFGWNAEARRLTLAKLNTPLPIHWSRALPEGAQPTTVTVSHDTAGRYCVSILLAAAIAPLPVPSAQVGIDLGLQDVVVFDSGEQVGNPRFFQADKQTLATAQRRLANKHRGSKNRDTARHCAARIHARLDAHIHPRLDARLDARLHPCIADRRTDFLHKLSTCLIRENQTICLEGLQVKAMGKHPTLAKASSAVGWGAFVRMLEYKAGW
jgi:putative transposase